MPPDPWSSPGPFPPPPVPPGRRRRGWLIALFAVLAVIGGVGGVLAWAASGDDGEDDEPAAAGAASDLDVEVDLDFESYRDPDGDYEMVLPTGWVSTPLKGDVSGIGRRMFPDDPERATAFQQMTEALPRTIVFVSLDPEQMATGRFADNFNLTRQPAPGNPSSDELADELRAGIEFFGGSPTGVDRLETAAGEAVRVTYDLGAPPGVSGIQYPSPCAARSGY